MWTRLTRGRFEMKDIFRKSVATLLVFGMTLSPAVQNCAMAQDDWEEESEQPQVVKLGIIENIKLSVGQSQIVYATGLNKVIVNTPEVVEVTVLNDREIMILGKSSGATDLLLFGDGARKDYRIEVREESGGIEDQIANLLGVRTVEVVMDKGIVFLKGSVPNAETRDRTLEIARAYSARVVDLLTVGVVPVRTKSASSAMARMMMPEPTLQERIQEQTGGAMIEVEESDAAVILKGVVDDSTVMDTAASVAAAFSQKKIINLIKLETQFFSLSDEIRKAINCPTVKVKLVYQGGQLPKDPKKIDSKLLTVLLAGTVPTGAKRQISEEIAKAFNGNVINHLTVAEPQQVVIEAKFVEVSKELTKELGFTWGDVKASSSGYGDDIATGVIRFVENIGVDQRGDATVTGAPVSDTYNPFNIANLNRLNPLAFRMTASKGENSVKVLSSPRILTLSGTEAELKVGGQVPVTTIGKDGNPVTEWKDYGISLNIKPTVDATGKIRADIDTEVSDLDYAHSDKQGNPAVKSKSAKTVVYVHDRDTIVISGLMTNQKAKQKNGVPYLMDIPVLGKLFSSSRWVNSKSELLVFLTPRVIQSQAASADVVNPPIRADLAGTMDTASSEIIATDKRIYDMKKNGTVGVTLKSSSVKAAKSAAQGKNSVLNSRVEAGRADVRVKDASKTSVSVPRHRPLAAAPSATAPSAVSEAMTVSDKREVSVKASTVAAAKPAASIDEDIIGTARASLRRQKKIRSIFRDIANRSDDAGESVK
jgi:Flp pilus assembly secretin CpaC